MRPANLTVALWSVVLAAAAGVGCAHYDVRYEPAVRNTLVATGKVAVAHGTEAAYRKLMEESGLPHNAGRKQFELRVRAVEALTGQLGSGDYAVLGVGRGSGNAEGTPAGLAAAMEKRAMREGGDVVLYVNEGVVQQPYTYTSPGEQTTYVNRDRQGRGTSAYTTFSPGYTTYGVDQLPYARAWVLKYVPGLGERSRAVLALPDARIREVVEGMDRDAKDPAMTFEGAQARAAAMVGGK